MQPGESLGPLKPFVGDALTRQPLASTTERIFFYLSVEAMLEF